MPQTWSILESRRRCLVAEFKSNPYLNWPPTKLKREVEKAEGHEKDLMKAALKAWGVAQSYDRLQSVGRSKSK